MIKSPTIFVLGAILAASAPGAHAFETGTTPAEALSISVEAPVSSDQAGRVVVQDGIAIGTLLEVLSEEDRAIIALSDGSEKEVALTDLSMTDDGSVMLASAYVEPEDEQS